MKLYQIYVLNQPTVVEDTLHKAITEVKSHMYVSPESERLAYKAVNQGQETVLNFTYGFISATIKIV